MKNKKFVLDTGFIKAALDEKLSLEECLLLLYFDNSFDMVFDINLIKTCLGIDEEIILKAFSDLTFKKLIKVDTIKNEFNKTVEVISLDNFHNKIKEKNNKEETEIIKTDIFTRFEEVFGRTLSPMDFEIIKAWLEKGITEELILLALKESEFNKVYSLRYIDKILFDWQKKGIKNKTDLTKEQPTTLYSEDLLNYNWLEDE